MLSFLLISASQGIMLSLALVSSIRRYHKSNFFLGLITFIISLEILTTWAIQSGYTAQPDRIPFWNISSLLLLPPAIFLVGKINTQPGFHLNKWHLWLFAPALLEMAVESFTEYTNNYLGTSYRLIENSYWFTFTELLPLVTLLLVLVLFGLDIKKLAVKYEQLKIQNNHLRKVKVLYLLLSVIALLWVLEAVFYLPIFQITLMVLCFIIYLIGYMAFFNPNLLVPPPIMIKATAKDSNTEEADLDKIINAFEQDKIYLQPRLTIKQAAEHLDISPRYLSELINKYHQQDFRNFINTFRINEVIRQVENGDLKYKTLLALALDAGFNSKSTFNQAFKDLKGQSPSAFFGVK